MYFIKKHGIKKFIEQQRKRIKLLETMIGKFDEGRSRSFFCKAAIFHDPRVLEISISKATKVIKSTKIKQIDKKSKAKILKSIITEIPFTE